MSRVFEKVVVLDEAGILRLTAVNCRPTLILKQPLASILRFF